MTAVGGGRIADNIVHFGRSLRKAGLPVGPAAIIDAMMLESLGRTTTAPQANTTRH